VWRGLLGTAVLEADSREKSGEGAAASTLGVEEEDSLTDTSSASTGAAEDTEGRLVAVGVVVSFSFFAIVGNLGSCGASGSGSKQSPSGGSGPGSSKCQCGTSNPPLSAKLAGNGWCQAADVGWWICS